MDLCLTTIPLPGDSRPAWIKNVLQTRSWTRLIASPRYDAIRADAEYAFRIFDEHMAYVPEVSRKDETLIMEWREDGKFFILFLAPDTPPAWSSGHVGGRVDVEVGRPLSDVVPGLAMWLSPPVIRRLEVA